MAFPTIRSTNSGRMVTASSTVTVSLPYGHVQNDLLIIAVSMDGSRTMSAPAGWTLISNPTNTTANRLAVWYKVRGFTESNPSISIGATEMGTWISICITKDTYSGTPEIATVYGVGNTPDAPSLTASWGAKDNLWFAIQGWDYNYAATSTPTGFTDLETQQAYSTSGASIWSSYKQDAVATLNPSSITITTGETWYAHTVVVRPAAVAYEKVSVKVNDTWRSAAGMWIKVDGVWKTMESLNIKVGDVWKTV